MKINILVLTIIFAVSASAHAQYYADPHLYYSVGGGRATTPTIIDPNVRFGFRASSSGFACGNFDPKLDIRSMLGGVGNSMADLGSLQSSLTGALPGQILCRAQPSLCQLMQHYTVRAEDQWRFSIDACELLQQTSAGGPNASSDWQALGKAQTWERLAQTGASDAVSIQQQVSEETDPCVTWVEGKEAGCPGEASHQTGARRRPCRLVCIEWPACRLRHDNPELQPGSNRCLHLVIAERCCGIHGRYCGRFRNQGWRHTVKPCGIGTATED